MKTGSFSHVKVFIISALLVIFYNEFLVYWLNYLSWPIGLNKKLDSDATRLFLIADPQLIGENDEPWYQSSLARWDSDRYLRNTFLLANSYVKPDATVFLGDLFDEGLSSTNEQFKRYYKRFMYIYQCEKMLKTYDIRQIYIPGDNDIGGEYFGDRTKALEKRFEIYFGNLVDTFKFNSFINFLKLDLDNTVSHYRENKREMIKNLYGNLKNEQKLVNTEKFTLILNHASILMKSEDEIYGLVEDLNACLVIKGDSHTFYLAKFDMGKNKVTQYHQDRSKTYTLNLQPDRENKKVNELYELSIPTCSYRMGVPNMGFGVLTIESNGTANLSMIWLPSRFQSIKNYGIYILCTVVYFLIFFVFKKMSFRLLGYLYRNIYSYCK